MLKPSETASLLLHLGSMSCSRLCPAPRRLYQYVPAMTQALWAILCVSLLPVSLPPPHHSKAKTILPPYRAKTSLSSLGGGTLQGCSKSELHLHTWDRLPNGIQRVLQELLPSDIHTPIQAREFLHGLLALAGINPMGLGSWRGGLLRRVLSIKEVMLSLSFLGCSYGCPSPRVPADAAVGSHQQSRWLAFPLPCALLSVPGLVERYCWCRGDR